jgi:hypothetical protein
MDNLQESAAGDALAAATLTHEAQRLVAFDSQVDPVDRLDRALIREEVNS